MDDAVKKIKRINEYCNCCGQQINMWDKRCSNALAYKLPLCEKCIAKEYDMEIDALRSRLEDFFGIRPCVGI